MTDALAVVRCVRDRGEVVTAKPLQLELASDLPGLLPGTRLVVVHEPPPWSGARKAVVMAQIMEKLAKDFEILVVHGD